MSGGSWDYFCYKAQNAANDLKNCKCPYRRALGKHMVDIADAMHDIEWVDSCDMGTGDDIPAIKKAISKADVKEVLMDDAKEVINQLKELGAEE